MEASMSRVKTSARHFAIFRAEAERLQKLWGLNDIGLHYHHGKRDARATFYGRETKRVGTLVLSTHWEDHDPQGVRSVVLDAEVRDTARHEMVHALVLPLASLIGDFTTRDEAERAEEALVQRLMRLLP
jgi:hypothetical protein